MRPPEEKKTVHTTKCRIAIGGERVMSLFRNGMVAQEVDEDICPAVVFVGVFFWW